MTVQKHTVPFLVIIGILFAVFFARDWFVFYQCGAVESCLAESSYVQHFTKFAVTALIVIKALFFSKDCLGKRDLRFLQVGMLIALCADSCFKIFHNVAEPSEILPDYTLMGVCFFMVFQLLLIYRHTRTSVEDRHFPKVVGFPAAAAAAILILHLAGIFESVLVSAVAIYGAILICSLVVACRIHNNVFFPKKNGLLIKWGMIIFFIGDVLVGISLATGPDHSTQSFLATVANNLVWVFYVPAMLCILFSGCKDNAEAN